MGEQRVDDDSMHLGYESIGVIVLFGGIRALEGSGESCCHLLRRPPFASFVSLCCTGIPHLGGIVARKHASAVTEQWRPSTGFAGQQRVGIASRTMTLVAKPHHPEITLALLVGGI